MKPVHVIPCETPPPDWCNHDLVMSSLLEAVSLITPVLEGFFMRTVGEAMRHRPLKAALRRECQRFIAEEGGHSRWHKQFNDALCERYPPPAGVRRMRQLLAAVHRHASLRQRLLLAAALEHTAAVLSQVYIRQTDRLPMASAYARQMFALHAREELGHCSVVFDLWQAYGGAGCCSRWLVMAGMTGVATAYVSMTLPWIITQKQGCGAWQSCRQLVVYALTKQSLHMPWRALLAFTSPRFHPDHMFSPKAISCQEES